MTDTRVALGSDRLPWLPDEPAKPRKGGVRQRWPLVASAVVLVAGAAYWLGIETEKQGPASSIASAPNRQTVTSQLPQARALPPAEQVAIAPAPEVRPAPAPEVQPAPAPVVRSAPASGLAPSSPEAAAQEPAATGQANGASGSASEKGEPNATAAASPGALAPASSLRLWPSRVAAGASGRLVQIGAFGSVHQAKLGWRHMARAYPGVKRLPAVVVETRNSKGRKFYRFQIGTTSQAHSEVLCQRVEKIPFSCAVVGLPWKPRGVER